MGSALRYKHTDVPRQPGELARVKVIQGPDSGAVYIISGPKASIGRGEECDIIIADLKASRLHAEMTAGPKGWMVKDKGSANGILLNGKPSREGPLNIGDSLSLGETTLEFTTSDVGTRLLVAPPRPISQIQSQEKIKEEYQKNLERLGLRGAFEGIFAAGKGPTPGGAANSRGRLVLILVVLGVLYLFLGGDDKPKVPRKPKEGASSEKNLAAYLPSAGDVTKVSETLFKDGFREYLAGNYTRARTQFETVLQVSPGHALATLYLENCEKAVQNEVKMHLEAAKRSQISGKLRDSKAHYERVMRLLYRDQSNPHYIEAKEAFEKVTKIMTTPGGGDG